MSRSSVVKLVILGVLLLAGGVGAAALVVRSISKQFTDSPVYRAALVRARIDSRVHAQLGTPLEPGAISGIRTRSGGWESSKLSFSIRGPRAEALVELEGEAQHGEASFSRLEAVLPSGRVDLLQPVDPPVAESDEDCRHSADCRDDGRCIHRAGLCVVGSWEDCKASAACRKEGRCYREAGECRPATAEHCESSEVCSEKGRCILSGGRCVHPPDFCQSTLACRERGLCTLRGDVCVAGTDGDCALSAVCPDEQLCYAKNGVCVALPGRLPDVGGKVTIGKPSLNGKLEAAEVSRVLDAAKEPLLACYQRGLVRDGDLRGSVTVRFVVGRDGAVANVGKTASTLRNEAVETCLVKSLTSQKFPQPKDGIVTVLVSVRLEASKP